eukprot:1534322-Pyramimonas_sp.AAC.1
MSSTGKPKQVARDIIHTAAQLYVGLTEEMCAQVAQGKASVICSPHKTGEAIRQALGEYGGA